MKHSITDAYRLTNQPKAVFCCSGQTSFLPTHLPGVRVSGLKGQRSLVMLVMPDTCHVPTSCPVILSTSSYCLCGAC